MAIPAVQPIVGNFQKSYNPSDIVIRAAQELIESHRDGIRPLIAESYDFQLVDAAADGRQFTGNEFE